MRKILLVFLLFFAICGCTSVDAKITQTPNNTSALPSQSAPAAPSASPENTPTSTPEPSSPLTTSSPAPQFVPQTAVDILMEDGSKCVFTLGMTEAEFLNILTQKNISFDHLDWFGYRLKLEGRECSFHFTAEGGVLKNITVEVDQISTDLGLTVGDSADEAIRLYGQPSDTVSYKNSTEYTDFEFYSEGYLFTIEIKNGVVLSWSIEVDTPEFRLPLITAQGKPIYLYTSMDMSQAEARLTEAKIPFDKPETIEQNTTCWRLKGIDLMFGTNELRPAPDHYDVSPFELYQYTVKTPDYKTGKGIQVGDTEEKLLEVYGPARETQEQNGVRSYRYVLDEGRYMAGDLQLIFTVENGKIVSWSADLAQQIISYDIN